MFKIVSRHDDALSKAAEISFEERMVQHLFEHFPDECAELGDRGVREMVGEGVRRAVAKRPRPAAVGVASGPRRVGVVG